MDNVAKLIASHLEVMSEQQELAIENRKPVKKAQYEPDTRPIPPADTLVDKPRRPRRQSTRLRGLVE